MIVYTYLNFKIIEINTNIAEYITNGATKLLYIKQKKSMELTYVFLCTHKIGKKTAIQ